MSNILLITSLKEVDILECQYKKRNTYSNNYLLINEYESLIAKRELFYYKGNENVVFLVKKPNCYRIYYYINNFNETISLPFNNTYLIEILFRSKLERIKEEIEYWQKNGFKINLVRDLLKAKHSDLTLAYHRVDGLVINLAKDIDEIKYACTLFNSTFDKYSADYIEVSEYQGLLKKQNILIAKLNGENAGAMHFRIEHSVVWGAHLAVDSKFRGKHIGIELYNHFLNLNKITDNTIYCHWTQHQNKQTMGMYLKMGFKYTGKSTISLIK